MTHSSAVPARQSLTRMLIPVMLCFFAMGFVDLVGIASNYVKADFHLSDATANLFASMVFFWFLVCSVPAGMLMNKIGRRKTVLLSLAITAGALVLPLLGYSFGVMMASFALLGIGNAVMQVSLNPLISNIVPQNRLASMLTLGQFVKAIASFAAPVLAGWAALYFGNWKLLYLLFLAEAVIAFVALSREKIKEEELRGEITGFKASFSLLGDGFILLCFIGIICHVGIDVGTNLTAPRLLMDRAAMTLSQAGYATSVYFFFRTVGCLSGAFILARFSAKKFFALSVVMMAAAIAGLLVLQTRAVIYVCIALIGYGNSNIFSIIFSQALLHKPREKNEVSGLMIMGLVGGAVFPLVMGLASDALRSQTGAVGVMGAAVLYLLFAAPHLKAGAPQA